MPEMVCQIAKTRSHRGGKVSRSVATMPPMEKHGAIMLVFRDDTVLLQLREDFRVWAFPGGGVEHGERWQDAAVR